MYDNLHVLANTLSDRKFRKAVLSYHIHQYALKFGDFTFASGMKSNNKFDLELLPDDAYDLATDMLVDIISEKPDAVFGVPNGGIPIAERIASRLNVPLISTYRTSEGTFHVREDSPITSGRVYGFEDAITTGGSTLKEKSAVEQYANLHGYSITVPKTFAIIRRMERNPETLLKPHGIDLSYILTTRELLGWFMFLYERELIELDPKWNEMWKPNL